MGYTAERPGGTHEGTVVWSLTPAESTLAGESAATPPHTLTVEVNETRWGRR